VFAPHVAGAPRTTPAEAGYDPRMRRIASTLLIAGLLVGTACSPGSRLPTPGEPPSGPYLGRTPPGEEAEVFAPGVVSTGLYERDLAITPDGREIYFGVVLGNYERTAILVTRQGSDGTWSMPLVAPFSGRYKDSEPALSPDGSRLWFASNRPRSDGEAVQENADLWFMPREGTEWGEPVRLGEPVNTDGPEFFPSLTRDGTLYFTRDFEGGASALFRARPDGDGFAEPERLGPEVNSARAQFNGYIAPDESYLIYGAYGREDSLGATDYYVSFRSADDQWTGPIHLGERVNSASGLEYSPYVSPDGRYFFFMAARPRFADPAFRLPGDAAGLAAVHAAARNGLPDIYWVDASFIEDLRP